MALLDKKVWKEIVALGKELGLKGERLAEYVNRQTQLKLDQDAKEREEQRKMAAEAEQRKMAAEAEQRKMTAETEQRKMAAETEQRKIAMELEEKKWPPKRQSNKKDISMNWSKRS